MVVNMAQAIARVKTILFMMTDNLLIRFYTTFVCAKIKKLFDTCDKLALNIKKKWFGTRFAMIWQRRIAKINE
jgi:hypothetical protein